MQVITGIHEKKIVVQKSAIILGQQIGNVTIPDGSELFVKGLILGNLELEIGSKCTVHGTIIGNIINLEGSLLIFGLVNGEIISIAGQVIIDPEAKVLSKDSKSLIPGLNYSTEFINNDNVLNFNM